MPEQKDKTIGGMNGHWSILFKVVMSLLIPIIVVWVPFMTVNQVLDNQFRGQGKRFTKHDAEVQTKLIISEVIEEMHLGLNAHAATVGHQGMDLRMKAVEARLEATMAVEKEETEILRMMQRDIRSYIEWTKQRGKQP